MGFMKIIELLLEVHLLLNSILFVQKPFNGSSELKRSSFPENFTFGTGSSSYQFEGAYNEDGRQPSIWDTFSHQKKEENGLKPIKDGSNGDVAVDQYHRYKDDVELVKDMGMDAYRFSISWSRVLPNGKISGGVNKKGIQFYNNLINELLSKGLVPYVTIFHWDVPQTLEDEYGGFLSSRIISDFQDFAELCYKEFGDRVKYWVTINEPWTFATYGYNDGKYAPGRCSKYIRNCTYGNSGTEPYIVGHNILLAHAVAVKVYREKYQAGQKGKIGISNVVYWMEPFSTSKNDKDAAKRALDFWFGWFMDPLTYGKYPENMRSLVRDRLPEFTPLESNMVKGSYDFVGINYYSAKYAAEVPFSSEILPAYSTDSLVNFTTEKNGIPIGPQTACDWLYVYPKGLKDLLLYTKENYDNPVIYITENGLGDTININVLEEILADSPRIDYHYQHLRFTLESIKNGVNVKGYFAWSFLDNFEWSDGYTTKFGLYYVDLKTMKRYPKSSSIWFKKFLHH